MPTTGRTYRRAGRAGGALMLAALGWLTQLAEGATPPPGGIAPDWQLDTPAGASIAFHAHAHGRHAVLFFWASWCPHCRRLFPHIEALRTEFEPRGVRFYALNIWEDGDALGYLREHGYGITPLLAADLVAEDYGVDGTPAVVVTDCAMRIRYMRDAGSSDVEVVAALRAVLDEDCAGAPRAALGESSR